MKINNSSFLENILTGIIYIFLIVIGIITLYPIILVISLSISDPINVMNQKVLLFPKGFSLESYKYIIKDTEMWISYGNTLFYAVVGTSINVVLTALGAYTLSRKKFCMGNQIMIMITLTMFFNGGLVPLFIIVTKLGIYNSR